MTSQKIEKILGLDYKMIFEAIRRLQDGTSTLLDEDKISALDLFEHMRLALNDHITFENQVLPLVDQYLNTHEVSDLCLKMKQEHIQLCDLLKAVSQDLGNSQHLSFQAILTKLNNALQEHLELEKQIPYAQWISSLDKAALERLKKRDKVGFLGLE